MNFFYVYILECVDKSYYVGHADDLETRLADHYSARYEGYTAARLPVKCVYAERFSTRDEAFSCERKIKGWSRAKKEALIRGDWKKIIELSNS